jgi:hypothetical protein
MSETLFEEERLAEKAARCPESFDFDDISLPEAPRGVSASLEALLGGFSEEIATPSGAFWVRPPKLREQRGLIRIKRQLDAIPADDLDAEEKCLDLLIGLAQCVLFVQEGRAMRQAHGAEIEAAFDAREVQDIVARATGWTATEGEQSVPPVR